MEPALLLDTFNSASWWTCANFSGDHVPRELGRQAGQACEAKAETVAAFDSKGASEFIHGYLVANGRCTGEHLVDAAIRAGYEPHDARAFGPVIARLVGQGRIRCVGSGERRKGHGTAGARVWEAV
jgi:hypothetical protein